MPSFRSLCRVGALAFTCAAVCGSLLGNAAVLAAPVDAKRIRAAADNRADWLTHGRTYDEQRFSPLAAIDQGNVKDLQLAWYFDLDTKRGQEATPLVVDGTRVGGVVTESGYTFHAPSVVLTAGTFLRGRIHVGRRDSRPDGINRRRLRFPNRRMKSDGVW